MCTSRRLVARDRRPGTAGRFRWRQDAFGDQTVREAAGISPSGSDGVSGSGKNKRVGVEVQCKVRSFGHLVRQGHQNSRFRCDYRTDMTSNVLPSHD